MGAVMRMSTTHRRSLLLTALAAAGCGHATQHVRGDRPDPPAATRTVASGTDTMMVLTTEFFDLIAPDRRALREKPRVDSVLAQYWRLFGAAPPRAAVVLASDAPLRPELLGEWVGVPMAIVLKTENMTAPAIVQRGSQRAAQPWPGLEWLAAQMWLFATVTKSASQLGDPRAALRPGTPAATEQEWQRAMDDTVRAAIRRLSASWFTVAATNLLAAPHCADAFRRTIREHLVDAAPFEALFALRAGAPAAPQPPGAPFVLEAQATSLLQFLFERDPTILSALITGLLAGQPTSAVLATSQRLPRDAAALEGAWREWVLIPPSCSQSSPSQP